MRKDGAIHLHQLLLDGKSDLAFRIGSKVSSRETCQETLARKDTA